MSLLKQKRAKRKVDKSAFLNRVTLNFNLWLESHEAQKDVRPIMEVDILPENIKQQKVFCFESSKKLTGN